MPEEAPPGGDDFCRADQHGHVAVVPAGVRHPGLLGANVLFAGVVSCDSLLFFNLKRCDIF